MLYSQLPYCLVDLLNTLLVFAYLTLIFYVAVGNKCIDSLKNWKTLPLAFMVLIATIPGFADIFLWHCGAASYTIPNTALLGYLAVFRGLVDDMARERPVSIKWKRMPAMAILSMVAALGTFHNGGIILLCSTGLCLLAILRRQFQLRMLIIPALMLACIAILLASPGNSERLDMLSGGMSDWPLTERLAAHIGQQVKMHSSPARLLLILSSFSLFIYGWRKGTICRTDLAMGCIGLIGAIAALLAFFLSPVLSPGRSFTPAYTMFYVFAVVSFMGARKLFASSNILRYTGLALLLYFMLYPARQVPMLWDVRNWWQKTEQALEEARGSGQAFEIPYYPSRNDPPFLFGCKYISESYEQETWRFSSIAKHYGLQSVSESCTRCIYEDAETGVRVELQECDNAKEGVLRVQAHTQEVTLALPSHTSTLDLLLSGGIADFLPWKTGERVTREELPNRYTCVQISMKPEGNVYRGEYRVKLQGAFRRPKCPKIYVSSGERGESFSLMKLTKSWE